MLAPGTRAGAVVVDRASGAAHTYDASTTGNAFYDADLVARAPVFALLGPSSFEALDRSAVPGPIVSLPTTGYSTLLATTAGYRIYDLEFPSGPEALMNELDAMDPDPQGGTGSLVRTEQAAEAELEAGTSASAFAVKRAKPNED